MRLFCFISYRFVTLSSRLCPPSSPRFAYHNNNTNNNTNRRAIKYRMLSGIFHNIVPRAKHKYIYRNFFSLSPISPFSPDRPFSRHYIIHVHPHISAPSSASPYLTTIFSATTDVCLQYIYVYCSKHTPFVYTIRVCTYTDNIRTKQTPGYMQYR